MWRLVLTLILFCWGSEATVTCKDNNNGAVDWYILYKAPGEQIRNPQNPRIITYKKEMKYLYIDSRSTVQMVPGTTNYKNLNDPSGVLAYTLQPILKPIRIMPQNFGFISYSDQPPGCSADPNNFGHSKGVLMVERDNSGVWLLHSTPQFPFRRDQNNFWPPSGFKYAQTFICVTFPYNQFSHIGRHLQYIGAFPFEHDIPENFHRELIDATKWVQTTPPSTFQTLRSSGGQEFYSIAKRQVEKPKAPGDPELIEGDLYYTIAREVGSDVHVQTWGCQRDRDSSYISNTLNVYNIECIKNVLGASSEWKSKSDHSKWCVTKNRPQNRPGTCIADVNRAETQYKRRGGALCINNDAVRNMFLSFAHATEHCTASTTMEIDCEPDLGYDTGIHMIG